VPGPIDGCEPRDAWRRSHTKSYWADDFQRLEVVTKYLRTDGLSAGRYSVGYFVERIGQRGFLVAIDYSRALKESNVPQAMLELAQAFQFERTQLNQCSSKHMNRVISPVEDGEVTVDSSILGHFAN
jgi:hypothetical protein